MPAGVAAILVILGGCAVYVAVWVIVLCVRELAHRRALRRVEFALIVARVAEVQSRPRHVLTETAGVVQVGAPRVPVQRRRVVCPDQPIPPTVSGHTTSTGRHARVAS